MDNIKLTTLSVSMYTNKGAYALLLGSGISVPAHINSGWGIEEELIKKFAIINGVSEAPDWHNWYKKEYSEKATYTSLLSKLAKKPTERVQLMRHFFEQNKDDKELGYKLPTQAHRKIANLAKEGYIKVILTTNFDRLIEKALFDAQVSYQVIKNEDDIKTATPHIHYPGVTIVKINGDMGDCNFRNTEAELSDYPEAFRSFLQSIFSDFGVISSGWSGKWDKGLIEILKTAPISRYNSFFTDCTVNENLKELAINRKGEFLQVDNANTLFSNLYDGIASLGKADISKSMSKDIILARTKKYLASDLHRIEYDDLVREQCNSAKTAILKEAHYNFELTKEKFDYYASLHEKAVSNLVDISILVGKYGKDYHIQALTKCIVELCLRPFVVEGAYTSYLHSIGAVLVFNALGLALVKNCKFKALNELFKTKVPPYNFLGSYPKNILQLLGAPHLLYKALNSLMEQDYNFPRSFFIKKQLNSHFKEEFYSDDDFENEFDKWEMMESLMFFYRQDYKPMLPFFLGGDFVNHARENFSRQDSFTEFYKSADVLKQEWPPIKEGLFGGKYEEYVNILKKAEQEFHHELYER
ncbi:MAG: SIR2 family protein [Prevotella sp.]|jgi:hypothetical protein|nr:SIR2 family protein [Prevotella sp.]MCI1781109.1 SIR2 family protein [Prevotella sp.]MCI1802932.1 SIR2 family protein [Prevotella sp.]MCI1817008.1 SIR2 family protein [Prevotella sp.]MCI1848286.1 SIR2 family protein [Prevotella sp.]